MISARSIPIFALLATLAACRANSPDQSRFVASGASAVPAAAGADDAHESVRTHDAAPVVDPRAHAELGAPAPDFVLVDLAGRTHRLSSYQGKIVVLEWFDPTCPAVVYAYGEGELREMKARHASSGIVWLAINSTAPGEEGAAPELNLEFAIQHRLRLPILLDPTGAVGHAYGARTAPHLFVISERGLLVYSGALDNAPRGRVESQASKTNFVDQAISDLRGGYAVLKSTTRPYGCEIKYLRP